jgi:hypothetical protein
LSQIKKCVEMALRGDAAAASPLTEAAADGEITPGEAASLSQLVANTAKAVETFAWSKPSNPTAGSSL